MKAKELSVKHALLAMIYLRTTLSAMHRKKERHGLLILVQDCFKQSPQSSYLFLSCATSASELTDWNGT